MLRLVASLLLVAPALVSTGLSATTKSFVLGVNAERPQQIHIALGDHPDQMTVSWITMKPASFPVLVWWSRAAGNSSKEVKQGRVLVHDVDKYVFPPSNGTPRYVHHATISGLQEDEQVFYRVGSAPRFWSPVYRFRVPHQNASKPLRIAFVGDLGALGEKSGQSIKPLIAMRHEIDVLIGVGDLAYDMHSENGNKGDRVLREMEPLIAQVPFMLVAGNHENDRNNYSQFQRRFRMPSKGRQDNQYYSFNLGAAHFLGVSSELLANSDNLGPEPAAAQHEWMLSDLEKANHHRSQRPWIIGYQHRPYYCSTLEPQQCHDELSTKLRVGHNDVAGLEDAYVNAGADLVLWGHEHVYERFWPTAREIVYANASDPYRNAAAPVYITTGVGGGGSLSSFHVVPVPPSVLRATHYGYTMVTVHNRTHLHIEQISVDQDQDPIVDSFWIVKAFFRLCHYIASENSQDIGHVPSQDPTRAGKRDHYA